MTRRTGGPQGALRGLSSIWPVGGLSGCNRRLTDPFAMAKVALISASLPAIRRLDTKCRLACQGVPPACSGDPLRLASSLWKTGGQIPRGPQAPPPAARGPLGSPDQPAALAKHDQDFKSTSTSSERRMTQQGALSTGKGGRQRAAEDSADCSIPRVRFPRGIPLHIYVA